MELRLSQDEIRQRATEKRDGVLEDARAFTRALQFLKKARASKKRAGRELTWRDAEAALHGRVGTITQACDPAPHRVARRAVA
jgi:hypothetical protein